MSNSLQCSSQAGTITVHMQCLTGYRDTRKKISISLQPLAPNCSRLLLQYKCFRLKLTDGQWHTLFPDCQTSMEDPTTLWTNIYNFQCKADLQQAWVRTKVDPSLCMAPHVFLSVLDNHGILWHHPWRSFHKWAHLPCSLGWVPLTTVFCLTEYATTELPQPWPTDPCKRKYAYS